MSDRKNWNSVYEAQQLADVEAILEDANRQEAR